MRAFVPEALSPFMLLVVLHGCDESRLHPDPTGPGGASNSTGGVLGTGGAAGSSGNQSGGKTGTGGKAAGGSSGCAGAGGAGGSSTDPATTTICASAEENGTATLTCPLGATMTSIEFASYGTPTGECGTFATGACDSPESKAVVESACVGRNSCTVEASNGEFGEPCSFTAKSLSIQARCTGSGIGSGGSGGAGGNGGACSGPVGTLSGPLETGIIFMDEAGVRVNAHGGGIIEVDDIFYLHGEYFPPGLTDNNFHGFSMYSSTDMATWKNEGIVLPAQSSGPLGPDRKGERPHIIQCPATGQFVLYAHAADLTYNDESVVFATASEVTGPYSFKGSLEDSGGSIARQGDMSAFTDGGQAYVVADGGNVYTLAEDCLSWVDKKRHPELLGPYDASEAPTVFKAGDTFYWIASSKSSWRANNNFYFTASSMSGPWTYRGFVAPVTDPANNQSPERTWLSQTTWVMPITGCAGTTYVFWGDHWYGQDMPKPAPGLHNDETGYVFQPLIFDGTAISMPVYRETWMLDIGNGTWSE